MSAVISELTTNSGRPWSLDLTEFVGDAIFMDRSWIVTGTANCKNSLGPVNRDTFRVSYDQQKDTLELGFEFCSITVRTASAPNSPVQLAYSIPEHKVVFVFRRFYPSDQNNNFGIAANSFMQVA
jgi:hypothetical protein